LYILMSIQKTSRLSYQKCYYIFIISTKLTEKKSIKTNLFHCRRKEENP
jgi:hypothetical protein